MQPREVGGSWKQEASLGRNVGSPRATSQEHTGSPAANGEMGALAAAETAPVDHGSTGAWKTVKTVQVGILEIKMFILQIPNAWYFSLGRWDSRGSDQRVGQQGSTVENLPSFCMYCVSKGEMLGFPVQRSGALPLSAWWQWTVPKLAMESFWDVAVCASSFQIVRES